MSLTEWEARVERGEGGRGVNGGGGVGGSYITRQNDPTMALCMNIIGHILEIITHGSA